MHESKHNQHQQVAVDGEHVHHETPPYWRRAHRDWRFWVGFLLMIAAITTYFMSDDLSLVPHGQPRQSQSDAPEK
jgi:hypothetical protein